MHSVFIQPLSWNCSLKGKLLVSKHGGTSSVLCFIPCSDWHGWSFILNLSLDSVLGIICAFQLSTAPSLLPLCTLPPPPLLSNCFTQIFTHSQASVIIFVLIIHKSTFPILLSSEIQLYVDGHSPSWMDSSLVMLSNSTLLKPIYLFSARHALGISYCSACSRIFPISNTCLIFTLLMQTLLIFSYFFT